MKMVLHELAPDVQMIEVVDGGKLMAEGVMGFRKATYDGRCPLIFAIILERSTNFHQDSRDPTIGDSKCGRLAMNASPSSISSCLSDIGSHTTLGN